MTHSLGQAVTLQQLAIDEQAIVTLALARPEAEATREDEEDEEREQVVEQRPTRSRKQPAPYRERGRFARSEAEVTRERGQDDEQQLARDRKRFSPAPKRGRFARPEADGYATPGLKKSRKEKVVSKTPARRSERFSSSEPPFADQPRERGRAAGGRSHFDRTAGRPRTRSFEPAQPQSQKVRRKTAATPVARTRRVASPKRSAGR